MGTWKSRPSATSAIPIMIRKARASIFTVGWRETKRPIGPAATSIRATDAITAAIITRTSSTMPTAVMIESSENTRSMTMIWPMIAPKVARTTFVVGSRGVEWSSYIS
ncbi:hypothetical protein D3C83_51780 [compost metagenome]